MAGSFIFSLGLKRADAHVDADIRTLTPYMEPLALPYSISLAICLPCFCPYSFLPRVPPVFLP